MSLYLNILHKEQNVAILELVRRFPGISRRTICRHAMKTVPIWDKIETRNAGGRPTKLGDREERLILRTVKRLRGNGPLCSKRIKLQSGIINVSDRTVRRCLNKHGFHYLQARKKGLLSIKDCKLRQTFCRKMLKDYDHNIWMNKICFILMEPLLCSKVSHVIKLLHLLV